MGSFFVFYGGYGETSLIIIVIKMIEKTLTFDIDIHIEQLSLVAFMVKKNFNKICNISSYSYVIVAKYLYEGYNEM